MNKSESKYYNTALLMDEALIGLLEVKPFEYITVKEICKRAGVNRSTFYLHYETIGDLLAETMERTNKRFLEMFSALPDELVGNIHTAPLSELVFINSDYLTPYLTFIKEHKAVYRASFMNPVCMQSERQLADISEYVLIPVLKRFGIPERAHTYWIKFYIHGCMAIIQEWLRRGCEDTIEDIVRIIIECIRPKNGQRDRLYGE